MIRAVVLVFLAPMFVACTKHATRPSPEVAFQGNYLLYKGERFTGVLEERFEQVETVRKSRYRDGLQHGLEEEIFNNGQLAARREYAYGKKVGVHEGWFADGKRRFHHEYKDSQYDGEVFEWYSSGALSMYARFEKGRLLGKKMWRETGQIYMNFVFPADRTVGLPGTKLCNQLRDE